MLRLVDLLDRQVSGMSDAEYTANYERGMYRFIPLSPLLFVTVLRAVKGMLAGQPRFLDVGCGIGTKVALADQFGFDAYGIEYNPRYVKDLHRLFGRDAHMKKSVWVGDALQYGKYADFDVIYFYCPMSDWRKQVELEKYICTQAKDGTLFIEALKQNDELDGEEDMHKIGEVVEGDGYGTAVSVLVKTKSTSLVSQLRDSFESCLKIAQKEVK